MPDDTLHYLSSDDVSLACEETDPVDAVREALVLHADSMTHLPSEAYLGWEPAGGGQARSINMPGFLAAELPIVGTKVINASTANPDRGLPRASGVVLLFDAVTARPLCVMQAGHISALRTAAVSVLACGQLLRAGASVAAMVGAGPIARAHAVLMARRLPQLSLVRVADRVPGRAEALCEALTDLAGQGGPQYQPVASAEEAVTGADLVVPCTTTRAGYIPLAWLNEGCLAVNVSLDDLCEDVLLSADRLYVDDWQLVVSDEHRVLGRLARQGRVTGPPSQAPVSGNGHGAGPAAQGAVQAVTGTLGDLVLGRCPGRTSERQLIVVNPFGMAVNDLSLAHRVYQVAKMRSLGAGLPR